MKNTFQGFTNHPNFWTDAVANIYFNTSSDKAVTHLARLVCSKISIKKDQTPSAKASDLKGDKSILFF